MTYCVKAIPVQMLFRQDPALTGKKTSRGVFNYLNGNRDALRLFHA
jgi:hypothetical protein